MTNDQITISLARNLDRGFADFVESTQHRLFGGLRFLAGDDAEDLAQETYLKAYRALQDYPPARIRQLKLNGWLWTIALNTTRNRRRGQARRPEIITDRLPEHGTSQAPLDPDLVAAVHSLPLAQRRAIVLHHVLEFTYPEIADLTGRPVGTIKSDTSRGLATLRTKGIEA